MASPLSGYFETPSKPSRAATIGAVLGGFGAGMQGRGQENAMAIQAQQQSLNQERQKAMAQDAMQVYNLLGSGKYDDAIGLIDKRVQAISQLGGDPSDTLEIRQLITSGRIPEATQELEGFLGQAMQYGLIDAPAAPEFVRMENGQAIVRDPRTGKLSASIPEGYTQPPEGAGANMGLSPLWLQGEDGQYIPAQLSSAGGMRPLEVPLGMRAVPPSGQLGFDPNAIATRGQAETQVQVQRTEALTPAAANQAAQVRGATAATDRAQGIINAGVEAAGTIPVITQSLSLLEQIETGGFDAVSMRARAMLGIESADEGELTYNLARNVLQQLRPTFGSAFTEREGNRLIQIEAGLGRNTETNKRILNQVLNLAKSSAEKALDRAEESGDTSTANELRRVLDSLDSAGGADSVPAQYSDVITPDVWRRMTPEQRAAFQ